MIAHLALVAVFAAAAAPAPSCLPDAPDPFRPPDAKATELNAAGKVLYRQGKWDEARAQYRAAIAADPDFVAPRLNIACSFVRQERFADALAEVRALLDRAYIPWAREILEAADLGALKVRPEMAEIRRAMAASAARWGAGVEDSLVFVGRVRPPLRVPGSGAGVFILNPNQEVFALFPATGISRQLTTDDGHVLLAVRSPDARRIVYVTAEKLVRGAHARDVALRGVALRELTPATMTLAPPIRVDGDVRMLEIFSTSRGIGFEIARDQGSGRFVRDQAALVPLPSGVRALRRLGVLTPSGAGPVSPVLPQGACAVSAREVTAAGGGNRTILVTTRGGPRRTRTLGDRFGAGLVGLPLP